MGSRDKRRHETKKPKKNAKKTAITEIIAPPVTVEVIRKKKRETE